MKLRCLLHTLLMSDDDVRFCDGPGMLISFLMHGFITLSDATSYDKAFYAIMLIDKTVTTFNHLNGMQYCI